MLPDSDGNPSSLDERGVGLAVAADIRFNLVAPKFCIPLWPRRMLRAAMPKATIDEHCDPGSAEDNVGVAPMAIERSLVDSVAKATCMERGSQPDLGLSVPR
jgi:hypothetical protein